MALPISEREFMNTIRTVMKEVVEPALKEYMREVIANEMKDQRDFLWKQFVAEQNEQLVRNLSQTLAMLTQPRVLVEPQKG